MTNAAMKTYASRGTDALTEMIFKRIWSIATASTKEIRYACTARNGGQSLGIIFGIFYLDGVMHFGISRCFRSIGVTFVPPHEMTSLNFRSCVFGICESMINVQTTNGPTCLLIDSSAHMWQSNNYSDGYYALLFTCNIHPSTERSANRNAMMTSAVNAE